MEVAVSFESGSLQVKQLYSLPVGQFQRMVAKEGIEPSTQGL